MSLRSTSERMSTELLFEAAKGGDKKGLKKSIKQGTDVNTPVSNRIKDTALIIAAREGHKDLVKELIASRAEINKRNRNGRTALMEACYKGRARVVKALLTHGAIADLDDQTYWSQDSTVHIWALDTRGDTALILAVREGHWAAAQEIITRGHKLIPPVPVDQVNSVDGQTALMVASSIGRKDIIVNLLSHGAQVNLQDKAGNTALIVAAGVGHLSLVKELLASGAIINHSNHKGNTALIIAARNGFVNTVVELLSSSASVDQANHTGCTALMEASSADILCLPTVQELISWGATVDLADQNGDTALLLASKRGHTSVVNCLLLAEAAADHKNKEGRTAYSLALEGHHIELAQMLQEAEPVSATTNEHGQELSTSSDRLAASDPVFESASSSLSSVFYPLMESPSYKGVTFFDAPQEGVFTSTGGHVDFNNGIELSVAPNIVPPGASLKVKVQPSFASSDVFVLPHHVESASPSFHLTSNLQDREMIVSIDHHVSVRSEEEALRLCFLEAQSSVGGAGVYQFEEVRGQRSEFRTSESIGRLTTTGSSRFIKIGRKLKRLFSRVNSTSEPSSPTSPQSSSVNRYSVRIYRSLSHTPADKMALVVVSLYGRLYTKFLETFDREVIPRDYREVSPRPIDRTVWDSLYLLEGGVRLDVGNVSGWTINIDKNRISRRELDIPEADNCRPDTLYSYPPKIVCRFHPLDPPCEASQCTLLCTGFDQEIRANIELQVLPSSPVQNVDPSSLLETSNKLQQAAKELQNDHLHTAVYTLVTLMEKLTNAISSPSSLEALSAHVDSVNNEVGRVVSVSMEIMERCFIHTIRENIEHSLRNIEIRSHQLCQVAKVKLKHCRGQYEQYKALEDLVNSGTNLMTEFIALLKSIKALNEVQSPSKTRQIPITSANEIAAAVGIHPDQLDKPCTPEHFLELSKLIPDWLRFSVALGLPEQDRNSIHTELSLLDYQMKAHRMLEVWFRRGAYTEQSHYRKLVDAALAQNVPDYKVAAEICKLLALQEHISPSTL